MLTFFRDKITKNIKNKTIGDFRMGADSALRIEIKNEASVELLDLTRSFMSIADEYKRYIETEYGETDKKDLSLFIKELKSGSIIADLFSNSPAVLPIIATANNIEAIIKFASYLKTIYDYLLGKNSEKPILTRANYHNISGFVEPVAKDRASQVNINTVINGNVSYICGLNSIDANAVQNAARREIELLSEPMTGTYRNVVFYWYQARNDAASQFGDKVIIESISPAPVKAIFDSEKMKSKAVWCEENPLTSGYIADVSIETIQGKPVLYKILDVHERIEYPVQTNLLNK